MSVSKMLTWPKLKDSVIGSATTAGTMHQAAHVTAASFFSGRSTSHRHTHIPVHDATVHTTETTGRLATLRDEKSIAASGG
ncbi:hypothetical protein HMPREF3067_10300 [Corynebacterium sp. HMSC04H06]|nr:hypothetical protein HMPREF3067_10300 [Corynebacterium sp. HMSC04H06]